MKETDLLRAMNDIDEEYIAEASPAVPEIKKRRPRISPKTLAAAGLFTVFLIAGTRMTDMMRSKGSAAGGVMTSQAVSEEKTAMDEAEEESAMDSEAAAAQNMPMESAGSFSVPESFQDYDKVTFTVNEDTEEAIYENARGIEGLVLTRKMNNGRTDGLITESLVREGDLIKEAEWVMNGYIYHAVFAKPVNMAELLVLISEVN